MEPGNRGESCTAMMRVFRFCHCVFVFSSAVAWLAGCGGLQPSLVAPDAMTETPAGASWMLPEARGDTLLYVSGGSAYVNVYSFPKGKLVGTLTGFQEVTGVCTDAAGDVWVANSAAFDLIEYPHGGSSPIAVLSDYESYPFSCSVDLLTGDLAVTNILSIEHSEQGGIAIYRGASGTPQVYRDARYGEYYFLGYGPNGKLYFDGNDGSQQFEMARLYRGRFDPLTIRGATIMSPGGVQYAEGSLTIGGGDRSQNAIVYRITSHGTVTGSTTLAGAYSCPSYEIWKTWIICASSNGNVPIYKYPRGGNPVATIGASTGPFQVVISEAPHRTGHR